MNTARTPVLDIAYEERGPANGRPVVLLHGFPDDVHAYDEVAPPLAAAGYRVVTPYLRGYGPTRFLDPQTPRSGEQAALGRDLLDLIEALDLSRPILAGYDWGGRAACIVAALWPERVGGLVSGRRLQHPEHRRRRPAAIAGRRIPLLVPVVLQHGTRRRRADPKSRAVVPPVVGVVVAQLPFRRCDLSADGGIVR
jgi:pimeloyl-ACP methyl ester carboxylesterase